MKTMSLALIERLERVKSAASSNREGQDHEAEYCPICYEVELKDGTDDTVKLSCEHKFCRACLMSHMKIKIESNKLEEL